MDLERSGGSIENGRTGRGVGVVSGIVEQAGGDADLDGRAGGVDAGVDVIVGVVVGQCDRLYRVAVRKSD